MKKLLSSFEGELVKYYDMFFLQNNIKKETDYIRKLMQNSINTKTEELIDIGCGTGFHDYLLSKHFKKITALDISKDMIQYANTNHNADNIHYLCQDITNFSLDRQSCVAMALSHVIGYQLENLSVENMFLNVNQSLRENGIFLFNFYYAPALFQGNLKSRLKQVEDKEVRISRFSNAVISARENVLLLDYYYIIEEGSNKPISIEIHEKMRYFTLKEIEYFLDKIGFRIEKVFRYGTKEPISDFDWNVGVLAHKIRDAENRR